MSVSAYKRVVRENDHPREIERRVFSRITQSLSQHATVFDALEDRSERLNVLNGGLQLALSENVRLWAVLKADLGRAENQLPEKLRAQLISLALVVERMTGSILHGEGKVGHLIAINRPIIDGLAGISAPSEAA